MSRNGPEYHCEGCNEESDEYRHPYSASKEEFTDIAFLDGESAERGCFGLAEEYENGIELVLVRDEEEEDNGEGDEKL